MASETSGSAGAIPARCVLLHQPDVRVPEALLSALARRNIEVSSCTSAHRAMAMLCAVSARDGEAPLILLLVEGAAISLASALVDAVEMYVPVATVWVYEDADSPQLRAVDRGDLERWSRRRPPPPVSGAPEGQRSVEPKPGGWTGPSLKLVDGDGPGDELGEGFVGEDLGDLPDDDDPGSPRAQASAPGHAGRGIPDPPTQSSGKAGAGSAPALPSEPTGTSGFDPPVGLTDDELSMLLADDWTDPEAR